jgi:selenocysteine lyase/cysteine desulfurase
MPKVQVLGIVDPADFARRVSTVSFVAHGIPAKQIAECLSRENIQVWHGHNYALEIYRKLGLLETGGVRIGPVHYNTVEEVDRALEQLERIIGG